MSDMPEKENEAGPEKLEDTLHEAIGAADKQQVEEIVESISSQEALRQVSRMDSAERDNLISMLEPQTN